MQVLAAGESAAQLPWLWPDSRSLATLAEAPSPLTWSILRRDPGALILVLGQPASAQLPCKQAAIEPARFFNLRILESVVRWFDEDAGAWLDYRQPAILPLYQSALAIAYHARFLAQHTRACDPAAAWAAGLLVPAGWFALAAHSPALAVRCRADAHFEGDPTAIQQRLWGLDHAAIARRLSRRWQLPDWLRLSVGHPDLPIESVEKLGTDAGLYAIVQVARTLAEQAGYAYGLSASSKIQPFLSRLHLTREDLHRVSERFRGTELDEIFEPEWQDPRSRPGLRDLLEAALERRRSEAAPYVDLIERDLDRFQHVLASADSGQTSRLRDAKLEALAEFAAGASHEINNPLAVIAGQGQYLLNRDPDEQQRKALESIVRQTQRIHGILSELMQFARPPRIHTQRLSLTEIIRKASDQYSAHAADSGVSVKCAMSDEPNWIDADAKQMQTAIGCLVRNAIEAAAPAKGWVRIGVNRVGRHFEVTIEDSGPGLSREQREHMFDPFYCGRSAGRGRGLGLPTAWRLAREHGGDVRYVPVPGGPTQFVLAVPAPDSSQRVSA